MAATAAALQGLQLGWVLLLFASADGGCCCQCKSCRLPRVQRAAQACQPRLCCRPVRQLQLRCCHSLPPHSHIRGGRWLRWPCCINGIDQYCFLRDSAAYIFERSCQNQQGSRQHRRARHTLCDSAQQIQQVHCNCTWTVSARQPRGYSHGQSPAPRPAETAAAGPTARAPQGASESGAALLCAPALCSAASNLS